MTAAPITASGTGCADECGPDSLDTAALLATCDALVLRTLQGVGKLLAREHRPRFRDPRLLPDPVTGARPWHIAHTLWTPDEATIEPALRSAWDVVPALLVHTGCDCPAGQSHVAAVVEVLDRYTRDLCITGTPHTAPELAYRLGAALGRG